jgi:hypothetical protein
MILTIIEINIPTSKKPTTAARIFLLLIIILILMVPRPTSTILAAMIIRDHIMISGKEALLIKKIITRLI